MKCVMMVLFAVLLLLPALVNAGCGNSSMNTDYLWLDPNQSATIWVYSGVTSVPNNDPNSVIMAIFNFPAWAKARNNGECLTVMQRAAECNLPIDKIKIMMPPDCNIYPITVLGDPNQLYYYRLAIDCNKPPTGTFIGQVRQMTPLSTIEMDKAIVVNRIPKQFFWDCAW